MKQKHFISYSCGMLYNDVKRLNFVAAFLQKRNNEKFCYKLNFIILFIYFN